MGELIYLRVGAGRPGAGQTLVAPSAINSPAAVAGLGTLDYSCAMPIDRNDLPNHLFGIPDLDLSGDLCAEPLAGPWFRLGACSTGSGGDKQGVENVVYRQSMLLSREDSSVIFDKRSSVACELHAAAMVLRHSPGGRFPSRAL